MPDQMAQWLFYAISSGACAALNGVFAKLVTTQLTTTWAANITALLHTPRFRSQIELVVRGLFLALNIAFNGIMWTLFTRALTLATSTVRVSVINTSANFLVTAVLGALVFREELPGLWWLGAGFLVVGSVIIARRDEGRQEGEGKGEGKVADAGGMGTSSGTEETDGVNLRRRTRSSTTG